MKILPASWTQRYRPRRLDEIAGNKDAIAALKDWLASWVATPPKRRAALLYGPAGTGKTVSAEAASRDLGFELVEMNASDKRTTASIERIVGIAAEQRSLTGRKRVILLDEVDGIDPVSDRGAVETIASAIERTNWPLVLTANDPWDPKLAPLRTLCLMIQFKRLGLRDSIPYLRKICTAENLEVEERALRFVAERNSGDMRSMINDLQTLSAGRSKLTYDDVLWLGWRDRKESIFQVLGSIFNAKTCAWARKAADLVDIDPEMLFEWIYENAPAQFSDPKDREIAFEALAKADLYLTRMRKTQNWSLLSYALDFMTAGVAMARERTKPSWVKMSFPERIKLKGKMKRESGLKVEIGRKISLRCHISKAGAIQYFIPYLKQIFKNNRGEAERISRWLDLDEGMVKYLSGRRSEQVRDVAPSGVEFTEP
ncbi:replication factor C large subunit [Candidatus Bathyarchaeota archaeon]|nr:replication factor C large subunit [Candidatus Bathyarchaeota archaeon]